MKHEEDLRRRVPKPWLVWILWLLLGWTVGGHRFYLGYCSNAARHLVRGALITAGSILFILLNLLYRELYRPCPAPGFPPCFVENTALYRTLWVFDWLLFGFVALHWILDAFFNGFYIRELTPKKEVAVSRQDAD